MSNQDDYYYYYYYDDMNRNHTIYNTTIYVQYDIKYYNHYIIIVYVIFFGIVCLSYILSYCRLFDGFMTSHAEKGIINTNY